jgi:hypothetical protein
MVAGGVGNGFSAVPQVQLIPDAAKMSPDRAFVDEETVGNLGIGQPLAQKLQNSRSKINSPVGH